MTNTNFTVDRSLENDHLFRQVADWASSHFKKDIAKKQIIEALVILLCEKEKFRYAIDIWDINYTFEELCSLLHTFDFNILECTIDSNNNEDLSSFMIRKKVRIKNGGIIWVIHANDADPFPSNPHAHNIENCIKLDLSNGYCYKKRQKVMAISKKDLIEIRNKAEKVFKGSLPELRI